MIEGTKGEMWELDPNLRTIAAKLIQTYPEELGYNDLDKIMFARCKSASRTDWMGKCYKLSPAVQLIAQYAAALMGKDKDMDNLDLRYIIAVNEDALSEIHGPVDKVMAGVIFHELKHIDADMEKIVKHDIQDFASLLDKFGVHWTSGQFKDSDGVEEHS
jgi:hypothetical protein